MIENKDNDRFLFDRNEVINYFDESKAKQDRKKNNSVFMPEIKTVRFPLKVNSLTIQKQFHRDKT